MGEAQYVRIERVDGVAAATVLREKITEHENTPVFTELSTAAAASKHRLILDMAQVNLLSSAGLGSLINLHKLCTSNGGRLVIHGLQEQIAGLMKLTHLHKLLVIVDSRADALKKAAP
jgi:anti-sigma B factor antagonist